MPICAWCGEPLKKGKGSTLRSQFPKDAGRPEVAWHIANGEPGCALSDPLFVELMERPEAKKKRTVIKTHVTILREIDERGPGRLVANRDWPWPRPSGDSSGDLRAVRGD